MNKLKAKYGISEDAVKKATGKGWNEWFIILNQAGAKDWSHKRIAEWLHGNHYVTKGKEWPIGRSFNEGWWTQSITVAYEYYIGRRILGQTKDSGFEVGVSKSFRMLSNELWELLLSKQGLKIWLGDIDRLTLEPKANFKTKDGAIGQVRTIDPGKKLRLSIKLKNLSFVSTLQVYLFPTKNGTSLRFHQEKLSNRKEREVMQKHWKYVLDELSKCS
jgi:hypothetical protein